VGVSGATLSSGFYQGALIEKVKLPSFRIAKYPITREQYAKCVSAGACDEAQGKACEASAFEPLRARTLDDAASPQTCLRVAEAEGYCSWIGGRLPTLPQWLLAARGEVPQRFAWGNDRAKCSHHSRAYEVLAPTDKEREGCSSEGALVIGATPEGASSTGVEDVLLTPGELLATQDDAQFSACGSGFRACFVFGTQPGAIEAVYPLAESSPGKVESAAPHVFGFRCVLEEK
jgi:formylglycine-generating enzyme required for sulfatase activity